MAHSLDMIPGDALHAVFLNLSVTEKLTASLVCKKWLEVLKCKSLLHDIAVVIDNNNNIPIFLSATRNFLNFRFKDVLIDDKYFELFQHFSSYIEYISFENCKVWRKDTRCFDDLRYDNLKVLKSLNCDLWSLFPALPNLKELYLTGNSTITDVGLSMLAKSMKHLEVFSILCFISYDNRIFRRFYPHNMTYVSDPSSLVLSFPAVINFIAERATTLREVHLNYEMPPSALKELTTIQGLCLHKINFNSRNLTVESLIDLFRNQPKLKAVDLTSILKLDENIIDVLCSLLSNIEEVSLRLCNLSTWSLSKLFQLKKLNKLDISGVLAIPADVFNEAVLNFKAYELKFLNLSHILYEAESMFLDVLFQNCKNLVHLDISNNKIPDCFIHSISKHLVHLEYLSLKNCGITDYGLIGQREGCFEEPYAAKDHLSLSNLKRLKELNLNDCNKITDDGILHAIKFKYLKLIHLNGCILHPKTVQKLLDQNPSIIRIFWNGERSENIRVRDPSCLTGDIVRNFDNIFLHNDIFQDMGS